MLLRTWMVLGLTGATLAACMRQEDAVADTGRASGSLATRSTDTLSGPPAPSPRDERARAPVSASQAENRRAHAQFLPDSVRTPGAIFPVTRVDVCTPGYARSVRNVPTSVKRATYESYGIAQRDPGEYEMDHLISLELGGSNSTRNLWPQSYRTHPWNASVKNALENRLHAMVCRGSISLAQAQHDIATDWIAAYLRYVHPYPPPPKSPRGAAPAR